MKEIKKIALMTMGDEAWIGGIQYTINILNGLNEIGIDKNIEVYVFKRKSQKIGQFQHFKNIRISIIEMDQVLPPYSFNNRVKWFLQRKLFKRINPRLENYLIAQKFEYVYPVTLSSCNGKLNVGSWIADFQYHNYPDGHSMETTIEAKRQISFIADKAPKILLSSNCCERECYYLFPYSKGKCHVMPFSVFIDENNLKFNEFNSIRELYGISGQFMMVSNLFAQVKNHKTLFEALGILRKEGTKINLICTGNLVNYAKMEYTNEILQIITKTGIRDQLFLLGLIPREHQVTLYRMSMAIIQPSLHEGWSTCVEEAKALGKTLLLSDIDVHKEQFPENPWFFSANNAQDLATKIRKVYELQLSKEFPEKEEEQSAFYKYRKEIRNFGENFLRIASI
jgi:glycosyltransferase involved in cell wall biosynthesis